VLNDKNIQEIIGTTSRRFLANSELHEKYAVYSFYNIRDRSDDPFENELDPLFNEETMIHDSVDLQRKIIKSQDLCKTSPFFHFSGDMILSSFRAA
jgi:hypothetical protein